MTPARHSAPREDFYAAYDQYQNVANFDVVPEQRIGRPLAHRAGRTLLKLMLILLIALGGTWAYRSNPELLQTVARDLTRLTMAAFNPPHEMKANSEPLSDRAPQSGPQSVAEASTSAQPVPPPAMAPPPEQTSTARLTTAPADPSPPGPTPPDEASTGTAYTAPPTPPADPNRERAEAAGLHPDISPALLAHLTATDFRNARHAIDTALASTADDATYVWPSKRTKGLALFKVHFVPGAGQNCRRYVVTIAKDGWLTTALPMERCGVLRRTASAKPR